LPASPTATHDDAEAQEIDNRSPRARRTRLPQPRLAALARAGCGDATAGAGAAFRASGGAAWAPVAGHAPVAPSAATLALNTTDLHRFALPIGSASCVRLTF